MTLYKTASLLLTLAGLAFGQSLPQACETLSAEAAKREFDVASVKAAEPLKLPLTGNPFAVTGGPGTSDPGRFTASHTSLSYLIMRAYGLRDTGQLKGPSWINEAMDHGFAVSVTMPPSTTQEQFCGMLRNLLADRFHLAFHSEQQPRPGYELTDLPGGPKFREFVPGTPAPDAADGFPILSPAQHTAMVFKVSFTGDTKLSFRDTMAAFALTLAADINQAGAPLPRVVDKTGLAGVYDIRLEFAGRPFPIRMIDGAAPAAASDPADAGPDIFSAVQKQLGLKLTKVANVPVPVMVIDRVDPTPAQN